MNAVFAAPWLIISMTRRSAMQAEPAARSALDTVPEQTIVPALRRRVRDQYAEVEVLAATRAAEPRTLPVDVQRHLHPAALPRVAQFVRRHRDRRERGRRLGLQEAEAGAHLGRAERTQAPFIDLHHQADAAERDVGRGSHRHRAGDHAELAREVDAVRLAR